MSKDWSVRRLDEVCSLRNGRTFRKPELRDEGKYQVLRVGNFFTNRRWYYSDLELADTKYCNQGDLLYAWSASFGPRIWGGDRAIYHYHIWRVDFDPSVVVKRFLFHWLAWDAELIKSQQGAGSTMVHVSKRSMDAREIRLPSLPEQERIADILDEADELRVNRRAAIAHLDSLAQSVFFDMFGDPISNPRSWPEQTLGSLLDGIDSGKSPTCLTRPRARSEWGVLKLGAVTTGRFLSAENKALPPGHPIDRRLEVRSGDLLFSRKNTLELVGATALVEQVQPRLLLPDLIFRLRLAPNAGVETRYLKHAMSCPSVRRSLRAMAGGSASSMSNISKARLRTLSMSMPPVGLQQKFASRLVSIASLEALETQSLDSLDDLFASLQYRAFRGEL